MKLKTLPIAMLAALALAAPLAGAVTVANTGQVLIYPYYTVNGGNDTELSVTNKNTVGKALRIQFSEAHNHRDVLGFNIYIGPNATWTANVTPADPSDPTSPAAVSTTGTTCTVPQFPPFAVSFRDYDYTGADMPGDAGPQDLSRTREGMVEIFEMGSFVPGSISAQAAASNDCVTFAEQWAPPSGVWMTNPLADMANPTGGLIGNASIINSGAGTEVSYNAFALENFRQDPTDVPRGTKNSVVMHTAPGQTTPTLADALTDPAKELASATVMVDGKMIHADYPLNRAIDAVTAALTDERISVDFRHQDKATRASEWVLNFPTRNYYTDEAIVGEKAIAPFNSIYPAVGVESDACNPVRYNVYKQNGQKATRGALELPSCYTVQTIPLNQTAKLPAPSASWLQSALATSLAGGGPLDFGVGSGSLSIDFLARGAGSVHMRPALDGTVFLGIPAIGFALGRGGETVTQQGIVGCIHNHTICP